ncbi:MAG: HIT family protein [Candidatus Buchananbacteria bacterium CG10_big_fil_rev_8_21_14_0_10_42_9]|uniref:HIT family protein n=1 Tax=Candidatus Buchananbacteria bacterium CG10_big_fil_rev_8_21_14_0_10_42_9 TaxID=1974526 RepID=A0A2H0W2E2_9BACT|nr:MAG: HIT family protein [Candidatus Buchananbacteria bacterium CG10_big_fil_rev_8_21_14_0_10_42_9]
MADCIFCKIVTGDIPSTKVYEDDNFLAFLDIAPITPGHTLVIPKEHVTDTLDMDENTLKELAVRVKKIAHAIVDGLDVKALNIGVNNGADAGQVVFHAHWHLIPRRPNDGLKLWPGGGYRDQEEVQSTAEAIRNQLQ